MIELTPVEARVVGALIEKEVTTPDQYPLSLKGLTVACNQKSNRDPVMNLEESEVQQVLDDLSKRNLVAEVIFGSRVTKYKHRFCNSEFSPLQLNSRQLGVLCVMLLRGPQTPGELRTRTQRLSEFADVSAVEQCLESLIEYAKGTLIVKLAREPGKRESRFMHLFSGEPSDLPAFNQNEYETGSESTGFRPGSSTSDQESRIALLEEALSELRGEFDSLKAQWDELNG